MTFRALLTLGGLWLCLLLGGAWCPAIAADSMSTAADPRIAVHDGFVDEKICASCHAVQAAAFSTSNHAKAMALADDSTVRADFNGTRFEHDGIVTTFFRRDGRFLVRTQGPDGEEGEFEVKYTFAYEPLQQYLIDIGGGRLQALDIAWDTGKRAWFWLGTGEPAMPGSTYHWTGPFYRWNRTCIDCHSTDPKANFHPDTGEYGSTYVSTSIGCQSCHGGGAKHVEWAKSENASTIAEPGLGLSPVDATTCFGCHSRRVRVTGDMAPSKPFLDQFSPSLLRADLYFPDGRILDEVFEYGSFQQSKMARAGVTCLDCHKPHEGAVKAADNSLCTQCHAETGQDRFVDFDPRGAFDTPLHTHHPEGSAGSLCVNCHMPARTYMKVDPRRDHSLVIPRPDLSAAYGTPNACVTCHRDKTDAWAAETMDTWYGTAWRDRPTTAHAFAAAARNDPAAVDALRALVADRDRAGIVKGTAIAEMSRLGGEAVVGDVAAAAKDADPLVRLGAAQAAANLPPERRMEAVSGLLQDDMRAVRVAAATSLGSAPTLDLLGNERSAFDAAVADLRSYVEANADSAEAQNGYGLFLAGQQKMAEAEAALRRAIALDPSLSGAYANLAELFRATGEMRKSQQTYVDAVAMLPDDAGLRYGYALSLVRAKNMPAALSEFERAVRLAPDNMQYRTTLAIALDSVGRTEEAFAGLVEIGIDNQIDASLLGAAIQYGLKLRRFEETLVLAERLAVLQPDNPQLADLVRQLRAAIGSK